MKVLYLEDELLLARIVKDSLESRGLDVDWFTDGKKASGALRDAGNYDIAVLDVQLPGEDGFKIGERLRAAFPDLPILYLTARVQSKDALVGFASGGNDYVRKPFSMEELLVRMQNLVNLAEGNSSALNLNDPAPATTQTTVHVAEEVYRFGTFIFDYNHLRLTHEGATTRTDSLSHREAELLRLFLRAYGEEVIERKRILLEIWHDDGFFTSRNLDVYVRKLRSLLEVDPGVRILTLRGVGYRFVLDGGQP
ncbi:response regulator transcription factor [Neolewinella antarctica]|uniref:DNA-binding response OmpR family regulator n=1 Tax=Neolewinella antarctica TaxID=442734 RepID=A0ABX0X6Y9_9BACT|nr:response regulator transcription factor [Neolewinella antarctica]NJC24987.1 DNA-binding response OmpR family regulator [Neolewinella antarctica]